MCEKKCIKCEVNQPIDNFRKKNTKNAKGETVSYLDKSCKNCFNARRRELYKPKTKLKNKLEAKMLSKTKCCSKCEKEKYKTSIFFHSDKQKIDGFSSVCKVCKNKQNLENAKGKTFKKNKKEYDRNRLVKLKKKRLIDPVYRKKEQVREERKRQKNKQTIAYRTVLSNFLRRAKQKKVDRTHVMLGYNFEQFKQRMEMNFKPGMSWDNHGKWHIDHIKPVSRFPKDVSPRVANALCNLQPLWAYDNLSKGDDFW